MKKLLFLISMSFCSLAFTQELTLRPVGVFSYNNKVTINKKRTAETVSRITTDGEARIKDLKKSGFSCIRKDQEKSLCTKIETNLKTPDFIQVAVDKYLCGISFTFPGTGEPSIIFDGANTDWLVVEDVMLGNKRVGMYRITKTFNGPWYVTFAVSEDQGIGILNLISNEQLDFPLVLEQKENGQTIGYFISATLQK